MMKVCFVVVVALFCGSLVSGQLRTDLVKESFPTESELKKILSEPATVEDLVNCITAFDFDKANCDSRLQRAHASASEYFRGGQSCRPPTCTPEESKLVNYFVKNLNKRYPTLYRKMLDGIFERETSEDYVLK